MDGWGVKQRVVCRCVVCVAVVEEKTHMGGRRDRENTVEGMGESVTETSASISCICFVSEVLRVSTSIFNIESFSYLWWTVLLACSLPFCGTVRVDMGTSVANRMNLHLCACPSVCSLPVCVCP